MVHKNNIKLKYFISNIKIKQLSKQNKINELCLYCEGNKWSIDLGGLLVHKFHSSSHRKSIVTHWKYFSIWLKMT